MFLLPPWLFYNEQHLAWCHALGRAFFEQRWDRVHAQTLWIFVVYQHTQKTSASESSPAITYSPVLSRTTHLYTPHKANSPLQLQVVGHQSYALFLFPVLPWQSRLSFISLIKYVQPSFEKKNTIKPTMHVSCLDNSVSSIIIWASAEGSWAKTLAADWFTIYRPAVTHRSKQSWGIAQFQEYNISGLLSLPFATHWIKVFGLMLLGTPS